MGFATVEDVAAAVAPAAVQEPVVQKCFYREQGCLFVASTPQEVLTHGETCGYGRMIKHIEQLLCQLAQRDREIERLSSLLTSQQKVDETAPSSPNNNNNVQQVLNSFKYFIDRLDEDSARLFRDAKGSLKKSKTSAYKTSMQVVASIKEVVESARMKLVAMLVELELFAKDKVRAVMTQKAIESPKKSPGTPPPPTRELPPIPTTTIDASTSNFGYQQQQSNSNFMPTPYNVPVQVLVNVPVSSLPSSPVAQVAPIPMNPMNPMTPMTQMNQMTQMTPMTHVTPMTPMTQMTPMIPMTPMTPIVEPPVAEPRAEPEEDISECLEASKQEYLKEQEARMAEEESVRQAMRLSLMDFAMVDGKNVNKQ